MRKRYTKKYRDWSPRWKWSARETRWLQAWEVQVREADWQRSGYDEPEGVGVTTYPPPVCVECRHYINDGGQDRTGTCDAFPEGIPDRVWFEADPHKQPIPGDHGIRFESLEPA